MKRVGWDGTEDGASGGQIWAQSNINLFQPQDQRYSRTSASSKRKSQRYGSPLKFEIMVAQAVCPRIEY